MGERMTDCSSTSTHLMTVRRGPENRRRVAVTETGRSIRQYSPTRARKLEISPSVSLPPGTLRGLPAACALPSPTTRPHPLTPNHLVRSLTVRPGPRPRAHAAWKNTNSGAAPNSTKLVQRRDPVRGSLPSTLSERRNCRDVRTSSLVPGSSGQRRRLTHADTHFSTSPVVQHDPQNLS